MTGAANDVRPLPRTAQLRAIGRAHAAAREQGSLQAVHVTGPRGSGRTSLLRAAATQLDGAASHVLWCAGYPDRANEPCAGLRQLLAPLLATTDRGIAPFDGPAVALHDLLTYRAAQVDPDAQAIVAGLHWVLAALGEDGPVLLLVDDADELDSGTRRALAMLVATAPWVPVTIVTAALEGNDDADARMPIAPPIDTPAVQLVLAREAASERPADAAEAPPLDGDAGSILRALVVLDEDATIEHVAGIVDLDAARVAELVDDLRLRELAPAALTSDERDELHARAIAVLTRSGTPVERIAPHALHVAPRGDEAVAALLAEAGRRALAVDAPDIAMRLLERALREPPGAAAMADVARAAALAALRSGDAPRAIAHWDTAIEQLAGDGDERVRVLLDMADALLFAGNVDGATASLERARDLLDELGIAGTHPLRRAMLASATAAVSASDPAWGATIAAAAQEVLESDPSDDRPSDRLLLVAAAMGLTAAGTDADRAAAIGARAFAGGRLVAEQHSESSAVRALTGVLLWSGRIDEELVLIDAAIEDARSRGSVVGDAMARAARGTARWVRGDVRRAMVDLERALALTRYGWRQDMGIAQATALLCRVEAGLFDDARAGLEEIDRDAWSQGLMLPFLRWCEGALHEEDGDLDEAAATFVDASRAHAALTLNPALTDAWARSVEVLVRLGRTHEAVELLDAFRPSVQTWGAARTDALLASCDALLAADDEMADHHFGTAIATLRSLGSGLDLARVQLLHARRLATSGAPVRAVELLGEALELSERFGCVRLARDINLQLASLGITRRAADAAVLTPGELRVATRAAAGASNRAIADELFLTVKTVEWHLSNTYAKLDVRGRTQLAEVFAQGAGMLAP